MRKDGLESDKEIRAKVKRVMEAFAAIEATSDEEREARANLERKIRSAPLSWEYLSGIVEGVNIITNLHPSIFKDLTFRIVARLVTVVTAKLALKALQEVEDIESFPEELG